MRLTIPPFSVTAYVGQRHARFHAWSLARSGRRLHVLRAGRGLIPTHGFQFEHILQDIQTLNERATRGELDISAISIHAYAYVSDQYALLPSGASMGDGYGPMLVAADAGAPTAKEPDELREWLRGRLIAVPGKMTSAYLALQLFLGEFEHVVVAFDQIFAAVKSGEAATGLIIHEGQLTYAAAGFKKLLDLGEWWKDKTGLPLPLGGNVLRKDLPPEVRRDLSRIIRESIDYGLAHRDAAVRHSLPYARDMDATLAGKFIGMYVNDFTRDYGETGRRRSGNFSAPVASAAFCRPRRSGVCRNQIQ